MACPILGAAVNGALIIDIHTPVPEIKFIHKEHLFRGFTTEENVDLAEIAPVGQDMIY
jgi:hypothetical protein